MTDNAALNDLAVTRDGYVATLEMRRPPNNFIDEPMVAALISQIETLEKDDGCRVIILAAEGKHFCAGADFARRLSTGTETVQRKHMYSDAHRFFRTGKPIVTVVQGAAVGAGLGLALVADFRIGCEEARLSANFNRQGYYPGFALTFTLPRLVGEQHATRMFYTGERVKGDDALAMGLIDRLVPFDDVRRAAKEFADEIAASAPRSVQKTKLHMRRDYEARVREAVQHEMAMQEEMRQTADYQEGIRAMIERRTPDFKGA